MEYQQQIAKGAALLDRVVPGWEKMINVLALNMEHPWSCVIGQLFDDYSEGTQRLFPGMARVFPLQVEYGFDLDLSIHPEDREAAFDDLTAAWGQYILDRTGETL